MNDSKMEPETFWVKPLEAVPAQTLKLPPSDQVGIRFIIPRALCFLTDEHFDANRFVEGLRTAVAATIAEAPFLAGRVSYADESTSRIQVEIPSDASVELRVARLPQVSGTEIDALHWPPHALPYAKLCLAHRSMSALNFCFALQANLLRDGVVIVLHLNHAIVDGYSLSLIQTVLASHLSRALNGEAPSYPSGKIPPEAQDRSQVSGSHPAKPLTSWKDWRALSASDKGPERKPLALTVWHIPAANVESIRLAHQPPAPGRLSTATSLSAFLWRAVSLARALPHDADTLMLTPMQARQRVRPQLHVAFCGNVLVYGRARLRVGELLALPAHEVGAKIDASVRWWDSDRIREYWGSVEDEPDLSKVRPDTNRDFGTDFEVSNIANMPFWNMDWGKGLRIRAFRWPGLAVTDGWVNILPRLPDGGFELMIHTTKEALGRLLGDKGFTDLVEYRGSSDQGVDKEVLGGR